MMENNYTKETLFDKLNVDQHTVHQNGIIEYSSLQFLSKDYR